MRSSARPSWIRPVRKWHEGDQAAAAHFRQLARVDLTVLTLVVADMVIKPFAWIA